MLIYIYVESFIFMGMRNCITIKNTEYMQHDYAKL